MAFGHAALESPAVDVVVVGAGVNGAAVSLALTRAGYRVLLIDQADVAGGTSQASTMLIWGGLLYLRRFDLRAVFELSRDRDRLIAEWPAQVRPGSILYAPAGRLPSAVIRAALHAYWRMGDGRRRPEALSRYPEQALFRQPQRPVHTFEEGLLVESDARFVLALVQAATRMGARVRTYTRIDHLDHHRQGHWTLGVTDTLTGAQALVSARCVVNATGAWADALNARAGITTPWRHVFSRGVSLALPRDPQHTRHLVVDSRIGDALTLAPWGPVSLWASTDTAHRDLAESWRHTPADVETLLDEYNRHFQPTRTVRDVLSVRVGVRALPVARTAAVTDTRGLTRHHRIHHHRDRAWVTIYGGQLSGCLGLADQVTAEVTRALDAVPARGEHPAHHRSRLLVAPDRMSFPGLASPVVTPTWAAAHEHCRTLDDYVRRRTNIAQWVPGGGFGRRGEHADLLYRIALQISGGDHSQATQQWMRHRRDTLAALPATDLQLPASPSSLISQE